MGCFCTCGTPRTPLWAHTVFYLIMSGAATSCDTGPVTGSTGDRASPTVPAAADELREPPVVSSVDGILDLLVIAKAATITQFASYQPTGLVYEICRRPADPFAVRCPGASDVDAYGGARLQVLPGDLIKIHLLNQLPPNPAASTAGYPGNEFLRLNPTNIHLHGMLVSPRYATPQDATWGDNVFVYNFNSASGSPAAGSNLHGTVLFDAVDYRIPIPPSHPSGLFWFHPHIHGISQDQITAGLAGIITVGRPPRDSRHLILKDMQVLADGTVKTHMDSSFCGWGQAPGQGDCPGANPAASSDEAYSGGRWYFTINGQRYPTVTIAAPGGQTLRITNASANTSYDLNIWNAVEARQMPMQVISIDGVSINAGAANDVTTLLHMMPSSRAEVRVAYWNSDGAVVPPPPGAAAILRTNGFQAGPGGDTWPAVDLAKVRFAAGAESAPPAAIARAQLEPEAESDWTHPENPSFDLQSANADVPNDPNCPALSGGHKRRIFYNTPYAGGGLGLGYEEVDENDVPVPGTFLDVSPFNPAAPTVCLPLAAGNSPATERWELVNLSGSDHNFHIHQAHFAVLSGAQFGQTSVPGQLNGRTVMMDSLPLRHADGYCATVMDWRSGACTAYPATVEISFVVAGDFVYHCHITAHEDAGMMAVIRVRSNGAAANSGVLNRMLLAAGFTVPPRQPLTPRIQGLMCTDPRATPWRIR
jgi:L-ascorbate oxidase